MKDGSESIVRGGATFLVRLRSEMRRSPRKSAVLVLLLPVLIVVWIPVLRGGTKDGEGRGADPSVRKDPMDFMSAMPEHAADPSRALGLKELERRLALMGAIWNPRWKPDAGQNPFGMPRRFESEEAMRSFLGNWPGETPPEPPAEDPACVAEREAVKSFVLTGIYLSSTHGNLASLGGQLYRVGDRLGTFWVKEISEGKVVIQGRFGTHELNLREGEKQ